MLSQVQINWKKKKIKKIFNFKFNEGKNKSNKNNKN